MKTFEFLYLMLFFLGIIIVLTAANFNVRASFYIPLVMVICALGIKVAILIKKHEMKPKHFIAMQLQFASPYVMMVVNLFLGIKSFTSMGSIDLISNQLPHYVELGVVSLVISVIETVICSLIMNKKTKKVQLCVIFVIIVLHCFAVLKSNVVIISGLNKMNNMIEEGKREILTEFIRQKISFQEYNNMNSILGPIESSLDISKDYVLAWMASSIAQLTIMLDVIWRPFDRAKQEKQINESLLNSTTPREKQKQVELTDQKQPE